MASGNGVERHPSFAKTAVFPRESTGPNHMPDLDSANHRNHGQRPAMDLPGILGLIRSVCTLIYELR